MEVAFFLLDPACLLGGCGRGPRTVLVYRYSAGRCKFVDNSIAAFSFSLLIFQIEFGITLDW